MTKPARDGGTSAAAVPHNHRWQLGANVAGVTPGRCACGETRTFTDEPAGPRGRVKRDALNRTPHDLIVEPTR